MKISFEKSDIKKITIFREDYLASIEEGQEYYLELLISYSDFFEVVFEEKTIGYFSYNPEDKTLFELYIIPEFIGRYEEVFQFILFEFTVDTALCKSFDHHLLAVCMQAHKSVEVKGILFRERNEVELKTSTEIIIREAEDKDFVKISQMNETVFVSDEEIRENIKKKEILLFEKETDTIGLGVFSKIFEKRPETDIGMLVTKKYRRLGYGSYIIAYMFDYVKKIGLKPQCGCAYDNIASRIALEKAGFISKYRLFEFKF